jgi:feruloyl esterase
MITGTRFKGQEGAGPNASVHSSLGVLGVTGFLMQNTSANPLDYFEGEALIKRREQISDWLDATNPDLSTYRKHGGKIIITIGTMDFIASSGAQLDYYQSVIDKLGQKTVNAFARFYVIPQAGHGLSGKSYQVNGEGKTADAKNIPPPNQNEQINLIMSWVEEGKAPQETLAVDPQGHIGDKKEGKGYLLCSYPNYPKYVAGPVDLVSSYVSAGH